MNTTTVLGKLRLEWKREELAAVSLPSSPPSRWKPGREKTADWGKLLGLKGVKLELDSQSSFRRAVWRQTQKIPWGETRPYGWVARKIGRPKAARAVGQALRRNPWPLLVPCHRVVRSDGSPGGFGSGRKWKKFLLDFERELLKKVQDD